MDCRQPPALQPRQTALSERPDRCGMGAYRAADPAGQARRRQTARRYPRGDQRRDVTCPSTGCQLWRALPWICRPEAPCMGITSACGTGTARWIASIMRSTSSGARTLCRDAKPAVHRVHHRQCRVLKMLLEKGGLASTATASMPQADQAAGSGMFWSMTTRLAAASGIVTAADVQDRDGGLAHGLATLFGLFPFRRTR